MPGIERRAIARRHPGRIDQVFHPQRQTMQQAAQRTSVECPGLRKRRVGVEMRKGLDLGFAQLDLGQAGAGQIDCADLAPRQQRCGLPSLQLVQVFHQAVPFQSLIRSLNKVVASAIRSTWQYSSVWCAISA